MEGKTQQFQSE